MSLVTLGVLPRGVLPPHRVLLDPGIVCLVDSHRGILVSLSQIRGRLIRPRPIWLNLVAEATTEHFTGVVQRGLERE